jgi:hypothetical protein
MPRKHYRDAIGDPHPPGTEPLTLTPEIIRTAQNRIFDWDVLCKQSDLDSYTHPLPEDKEKVRVLFDALGIL